MATVRIETTDAATGEMTVTFEEVPDAPPPTALDVIAQLDPATAAAAVAAGVGIAANAGALWDQLIAWHTALGAPEGTSPDDPAYTFAETVTDIALNAATQPGT